MGNRLFCEDTPRSSILRPAQQASQEIDIWEIDIAAQSYQKELLAKLLTGDERQRAAKFRQEKDENQFIVTRALLKVILAEAYLVSPKDIIIVTGKNGKPFLKDRSGIHFNVSHTHQMAVVALSKSPIGIDLEFINPAFDYKSVSEFAFSTEEINLLKKSDNPATEFFRLWTRKEAFLKGLGTGLVNDLKTIKCGEGINPISIALEDVVSDWKTITTTLPGNYIMSMAFEYFSKPVSVSLMPVTNNFQL